MNIPPAPRGRTLADGGVGPREERSQLGVDPGGRGPAVKRAHPPLGPSWGARRCGRPGRAPGSRATRHLTHLVGDLETKQRTRFRDKLPRTSGGSPAPLAPACIPGPESGPRSPRGWPPAAASGVAPWQLRPATRQL